MFSAPAVDEADGLVFGTFGNPYAEPASVNACNAAAPNGFFSESCEQPGAYWKSIVAFGLDTGAPVWSYRVFGHAPWQQRLRLAAGAGDLVRAGIRRGAVGRRRVEPERVPLGPAQRAQWSASAGRAASTTCFDAKTGALLLEHARRPRRRPGRLRVGHGLRRQPHLRVAHEPAPHPVQPDRERRAHEHDGHRRLLGGARPRDRQDPLADRRSADRALPASAGTVGVWDLGAGHVANGVVYAASMAKSGNEMYALDAATGNILWQYPRRQLGQRCAGRRRTDPSTGAPATRGPPKGAATTSCTRSASTASRHDRADDDDRA